MPALRLLALDIDGTLLRSDSTLSTANAQAVRAIQERGVHVILASGKPPWAMRTLAEQLNLPGPHVTANGAGIWSRSSGVELLGRISWEDVHRALDYGKEQALPRALSGPRGVFCQPAWRPDDVTQALREVGEDPPTVVAEACTAERDPWKVILIARRGVRLPPCPELNHGIWVRTGTAFLETVPGNTSKATAVAEICRRMDIPQSGVAAIGDSENDIPLLRWAAVSIAMGQSPPEVQRSAHHVTATNDRDGVARALEQLFGGE